MRIRIVPLQVLDAHGDNSPAASLTPISPQYDLLRAFLELLTHTYPYTAGAGARARDHASRCHGNDGNTGGEGPTRDRPTGDRPAQGWAPHTRDQRGRPQPGTVPTRDRPTQKTHRHVSFPFRCSMHTVKNPLRPVRASAANDSHCATSSDPDRL